jgi:hypothetical protein
MDWERNEKECSGPDSRYHPVICLYGLRKAIKASGYPVSEPRLDASTFWIQVRNIVSFRLVLDR